jgi:hypothetical protein
MYNEPGISPTTIPPPPTWLPSSMKTSTISPCAQIPLWKTWTSANSHSTLLPEEIPAKLRCGLCNLVAVNAVKLPCCETSICDKCESTRSPRHVEVNPNPTSGQAALPEQCTICEHQPLSPDVCTPMKSLRMTIKAHLKTELKRRTAQASAASATLAVAVPTPTPAPAEAESLPQDTPAPAPMQEEEAPQTASEATVEAANNEGAVVASTEQQDADQGDMLHTNVSFPRDFTPICERWLTSIPGQHGCDRGARDRRRRR